MLAIITLQTLPQHLSRLPDHKFSANPLSLPSFRWLCLSYLMCLRSMSLKTQAFFSEYPSLVVTRSPLRPFMSQSIFTTRLSRDSDQEGLSHDPSQKQPFFSIGFLQCLFILKFFILLLIL